MSPEAPTHPDLILVEKKGQGEFSSRAVSLQDFAPGSVFAKIEGISSTSDRTYATVQTGRDSDIELNSDLVFCNHSCNPSVVFDMHRMEVRVVQDRPLNKGEAVTFFYPSSEWDMTQAFECNCASEQCVGTIRGAKYLDDAVLERYWLNPHIEELVNERKGLASTQTAANGNGHSLPN